MHRPAVWAALVCCVWCVWVVQARPTTLTDRWVEKELRVRRPPPRTALDTHFASVHKPPRFTPTLRLTPQQALQREALRALYAATGGATLWVRNDNWNSTQDAQWCQNWYPALHPCVVSWHLKSIDWYGLGTELNAMRTGSLET
jgi:hypothetical protein